MEKLIFLTHNLPPYTGASSNIIMNVATCLHNHKNCEIAMIGFKTSEITPHSEGFTFYPIKQAYNKNTNFSSLPKWKKLISMLIHPSFFIYKLREKFLRYPYKPYFKKQLKKALKDNPDTSCIIASGFPFDTIMATLSTKAKIPFVEYKLDPWGTNVTFSQNFKYLQDEKKADKNASAIFVTPLVYKNYLDGLYPIDISKVFPVEFPELVEPNSSDSNTIELNDSYVNCAFVGTFYQHIRTPEPLLKLFSSLKEEQIKLHLVGNTSYLKQSYPELIDDNIVLHGYQPKKVANEFLKKCDVLVNLGNTNSDQLPSKLIEYFSFGKPILNLTLCENCPSLSYIEKYPLSCTVSAFCDYGDTSIKQAKEFILTSKNKALDFETVKNLFPECTIEYVSEKLYTSIINVKEKSTRG